MAGETVLNLQRKLTELQESWDKAPVEGVVPEGEYEGEVTDFDFFESHQGELFLKTIVTIRVPKDYDGVALEVVNSLSHPERVRFAKELLATLGVDVQNLSMGDLIPSLRKVVGSGVACRVVHNAKNGKTYQNVYVNDLLFAPDSSPEADIPADREGLPTDNGAPNIDPDLGF